MTDMAETNDKAAGERFRKLRIASGYENQRAWAAFLGGGITYQDVNNWERGRNLPGKRKMLVLTFKTDATRDWLIEGKRGGLTAQLIQRLDEVDRREAESNAVTGS